jgi:hypothetical protein
MLFSWGGRVFLQIRSEILSFKEFLSSVLQDSVAVVVIIL